MDSKLVRFFEKIGFNNYDAFLNAKLENVVVDTKEESWTLYIILDKMIPLDVFKTLCSLSKTLIV